MKLSTTKREKLYDLWRGTAEHPTCNLCSLPITAGQDWDESHNPHLPRALGGKVTGLAHRRCRHSGRRRRRLAFSRVGGHTQRPREPRHHRRRGW